MVLIIKIIFIIIILIIILILMQWTNTACNLSFQQFLEDLLLPRYNFLYNTIPIKATRMIPITTSNMMGKTLKVIKI